MKRFEMLPGIAVMRGNVTGAQDIRYQGNKKAYETANGKQASTNYRPSYIFHQRAKDGLKYYSVRLRQTAVLNGKTRMQMALIGAIAAIKVKLKTDGTLASIKSAYDYLVSIGHSMPEGVDTFNKYVDYYLRDMLRYKKAEWAFTYASISFTVANPFKLDNATALKISQSIFDKFAAVLGFTAVSSIPAQVVCVFTIDGHSFVNPNKSASFEITKTSNDNCPNLVDNWASISVNTSTHAVKFNDLQVYSAAGEAQVDESIPADGAFTTIVPES